MIKRHIFREISFYVLCGVTLSLFFCTANKSGTRTKTGLNVIHPLWSNDLVIYEVNLRQYSKEGTFKAFAEDLPRLKEMGINLIWLMPIHPIGEVNRKGPLGSFYAVKDYFAIDPALGNEKDFENLVQKVHAMDMHIIIDWVANHTAWDNTFVKNHPEWFTKSKKGNFMPPVADWTDVIDLDYSQEALQDTMIKALKFWVEQYNIDGYRCDVAEMVPLSFWEKARQQLDQIKPVFMLAEGKKPELHKKAFDMTYAWNMHHLLNDLYKGKKSVKDLKTLFANEQKRYPVDALRMHFTSNHDENAWNGTVFERMGDAAAAFAVFTITIPGVPLLYNGQEAGLDKRLAFFSKDVIEWKKHPFSDMYKTFLNLKHQRKSLWNGSYAGKMSILSTNNKKGIFAFIRKKEDDEVVCFFNFSPTDQKFKLKNSGINGGFIDVESQNKIQLNDNFSFDMEPWSYRIFMN